MKKEGPDHKSKPNLGPPEYEIFQFVGDKGRWTITKATKVAIAQTYNKFDAERLIGELQKADCFQGNKDET